MRRPTVAHALQPSAARSHPSSTSIRIGNRPGAIDRLAQRMVLQQLDGSVSGPIELRLPDGSSRRIGTGEADGIQVEIEDWSFFRRLVSGADIGAGESYMDGHWRCSDLPELLRRVIISGAFARPSSAWARLGHRLNALARFRNANTLRGSRRNIASHYDLGNALYELFLDETMMYSCAEFDAGLSLRDAQERKLDGICSRLGLRQGHRVLEIGSGWGGFAVHAAERYGCHVTTLTLSVEQAAFVRERVRAAGLQGRVDVELCDYRRATGSYDRLVSIEMFEAVGYEFYRAYFEACERLLRPGGKMFLQTITVPDQRFDEYRQGFDFIRKHVFPGGLLASLHEIATTLRRYTELQIDWMRDIGPSYAPTLRAWRERFLDRRAEVRALGYDERFVRMWEFYLASCEAMFATRSLGDAQIVLHRPHPT